MKQNDILLACNVYSNMYYFLQVTKATKATVTVRRIYANRANGTPIPGWFNEMHEPMTKRVKDGRISLGSWASAELWDGIPLNEWNPMFGKNYNLY